MAPTTPDRNLHNMPAKTPERVRALFLSDFHFGYKGVDAVALLECLRSLAPQTIYLAGDIIDGWKLAKRWHWRADYTRVLDALAEHRRRGAKIFYLPGNHDERVRRSPAWRRAKFAFRAGIRICDSCIHYMKDGRRIIVMHGDQFDHALLRGPVSRIGDRIHDFLADAFGLHGPAPTVLIEGRRQKFSLAKALVKRSGKAALRLLNNLERAALRLVRRRHADGIIFGHTHVPTLRRLEDRYVYANCGMWMGHTNTCLVETLEGMLDLRHWPDMRHRADDRCVSPSDAAACARYPETVRIIRKIRQLWPDPALKGESMRAKAAQRQKRIVDEIQGDGVHIIGEAAL